MNWRYINWRGWFIVGCLVALLVLGSLGWGVVVHYLAHCA